MSWDPWKYLSTHWFNSIFWSKLSSKIFFSVPSFPNSPFGLDSYKNWPIAPTRGLQSSKFLSGKLLLFTSKTRKRVLCLLVSLEGDLPDSEWLKSEAVCLLPTEKGAERSARGFKFLRASGKVCVPKAKVPSVNFTPSFWATAEVHTGARRPS